MQPTKLQTAVACEALDALCEVFGATQPALVALRSTLYPAIFMKDAKVCPFTPAPRRGSGPADQPSGRSQTLLQIETACPLPSSSLVIAVLRQCQRRPSPHRC
jgi:hypothetical protein